MNLYETKDFFAKMYLGKSILYEFDEKCHRIKELVYTDGLPNMMHHIENDKVKVTVEGQDPIYVPIAPHRETYTWSHMKQMINSQNDVFIYDQALINSDKEELSKITGLTTDQIQSKINAIGK